MSTAGSVLPYMQPRRVRARCPTSSALKVTWSVAAPRPTTVAAAAAAGGATTRPGWCRPGRRTRSRGRRRARRSARGSAWPAPAPGRRKSVAPSWRARSALSGAGSTAMICPAPAIRAPCTAASPTPPSPNTTTDSPGRTFAALRTAPTPVSTAQPSSAASLERDVGGQRHAGAPRRPPSRWRTRPRPRPAKTAAPSASSRVRTAARRGRRSGTGTARRARRTSRPGRPAPS